MRHQRLNPSAITSVTTTVSHRDGSKESYTFKDVESLDIGENKHGVTKIKLRGEVKFDKTEPRPLPKSIFELNGTHNGLWIDFGSAHGVVSNIHPIETSDNRDNWRVCAVKFDINWQTYTVSKDTPLIARHL